MERIGARPSVARRREGRRRGRAVGREGRRRVGVG